MTTENRDDPRVESRYVRTFDGTSDGVVTLVGVVHDHPASIARVRHVVSEVDPSVLALELPPLAVPLYEAYATGSESPPALGGELSAAVGAAGTDEAVGIDGPSLGFLRTLARRLWQEKASRETVSRSVRSLLSVTKTALACRVAATVVARTPVTVAVGSPASHGTTADAPASEQAADERRQIRAATAVMDAFETSPSSRYRAESRERHMVDRLVTLRNRGDVVAVVGAGHFDPICERLETQ